ncbi:MAG: hypothetical protein WD939_05555 [Dehalococcoidia bacterium]
MTRFGRVWLAAAALLLVLFLAACSSDDDSDDADTGDGQPTATEPTGDDTGDDGNGDGGNGDEPSGDLNDELRRFADEFGISEVKIAYNFSASGGGADEEGTMTLFWKPPDSWRLDFSSAESGDFTIISSAETSYICTSEDGGQCIASPLGSVPIPFLSIFTEPDGLNDLIDTSLGDVDVERSDREIAGQDASCFSISGTIEGESGEGEYCFRDDGVLLLLHGAGDASGAFSLEATSVEDSVSDGDLEPPYEITEIPGLN